MKTRTTLLLGSTASLVLAAGLFACSGDSTTTVVPDGGADSSTNDAAADSPSSNDAAADSSKADTGADAGDTQCGTLPKAQCQQCCIQAHPGAAIIVTEAAKCACQTPGLCKTQCATTLCAAKASDSTCTACLQSADAGGCLLQAATACSNDPDCTAGLQCGNGCK